MRKVLSILLLFVMICSLCSCNTTEYSDLVYNSLKQSIKIIDNALDANITFDEVQVKLDVISAKLKSENSDEAFILSTDIDYISYCMLKEDVSEVISRRNDLAEKINLSEYNG